MGNEILERLEDLAEGGALLYAGNRYLLLQPECLTDFQRSLEAELGAEKVGQALYKSAHLQGNLLAAHFQSELSLGEAELVRFMAHHCRQFGWGRAEITNLSIGHGALELEVFHSPFAEGFRQAEFPVCHVVRGFYAGVLQAILQSDVEGLETRCRAVEGPGPCTFVFAAAPSRRGLKASISGEP